MTSYCVEQTSHSIKQHLVPDDIMPQLHQWETFAPQVSTVAGSVEHCKTIDVLSPLGARTAPSGTMEVGQQGSGFPGSSSLTSVS